MSLSRHPLRLAAALLAVLTVTSLAAAPALADETDTTLSVRPDGEPATESSIPVTVTVPSTAGNLGARELTNAELRWTLNAEAGSGTFAGACNFLMAGRPGADGNAGEATIWGADRKHLYHAAEGNVEIQRVAGTGTDARTVRATWDDRCTAPDGRTVDLNGNVSGAQVVITGGTGTHAADGTLDIAWTGTFTVVFYGGLTYWWASDPVLHLGPDGSGTLTATGGGYGAARDDASVWTPLTPTRITLASFTRTRPLTGNGGLLAPDYCSVELTLPRSATAQLRSDTAGVCWGAFPQDFVNFQLNTGQGPYWYTSGGTRDPYKNPADVAISFDAAHSIGGAPPPVPAPAPLLQQPVASTLLGGPGAGAGAGATLAANTRPSGAGSTFGTPAIPGILRPVFPAVAAATLSAAGPGLVPGRASGNPHQTLAALSAVLLLAASAAAAGFRKGWLVLPFRR